VLTATMAGYAFARLHFRGRDKVFLAYLATSIIPAQLLLVPRFIYFQQLGLYDTLWALILPGMFTVLGTFLMRQFFVGQPAAFAEAARIDGANEWQIFWRLYLPMATPVMSALGILTFVWSWNDYETPLVLISSPEAYTLPLSLASFTDEQGAISANLTMAASVVSIIPVLIVFLVLQKRFVRALTHTGIKCTLRHPSPGPRPRGSARMAQTRLPHPQPRHREPRWRRTSPSPRPARHGRRRTTPARCRRCGTRCPPSPARPRALPRTSSPPRPRRAGCRSPSWLPPRRSLPPP